MKSLDPRVSRLPLAGDPGVLQPKAALEQFGTFEVFVQPKAGKPFQHEGAVHAPDLEMAYVLAKETFTRRFLCVSLYVADTRDVWVSPTTEGDQSAYELVTEATDAGTAPVGFEIYHLLKRGKQHIHAGTIEAGSPQQAVNRAGKSMVGKIVFNVWAIPVTAIRYTQPDEEILWDTLSEKKFRDAADYKGGEKLQRFLNKSAS